MSGPTKEEVLAALAAVAYPGFKRDIVAAGVVRDVRLDGGVVVVDLDLGQGDPGVVPVIERDVREALAALAPDSEVRVRVGGGRAGGELPVFGQTPQPSSASVRDGLLLPQVGSIVAVASGKGGVGKSTVAVNLAVSLAKSGLRVGLLDADIYGPSIPLMFGLSEQQPRIDHDRRCIVPFERYGVRFMSLGFLVAQDTAVIWRGPMVMKALEQLMQDVDWGELDILVVDMPPGTGDAQLTMSQRVRLSGAVIVTTPQEVALADAVKGVAMFRKVGVPVLGIVENMSYFLCSHCGERTEIFGHGGGKSQSERLGAPFLGEIPLDPGIREGGDAGSPASASEATPLAAAFDAVADRVRDALTEDDSGASAREGFFSRFRRNRDER